AFVRAASSSFAVVSSGTLDLVSKSSRSRVATRVLNWSRSFHGDAFLSSVGLASGGVVSAGFSGAFASADFGGSGLISVGFGGSGCLIVLIGSGASRSACTAVARMDCRARSIGETGFAGGAAAVGAGAGAAAGGAGDGGASEGMVEVVC